LLTAAAKKTADSTSPKDVVIAPNSVPVPLQSGDGNLCADACCEPLIWSIEAIAVLLTTAVAAQIIVILLRILRTWVGRTDEYFTVVAATPSAPTVLGQLPHPSARTGAASTRCTSFGAFRAIAVVADFKWAANRAVRRRHNEAERTCGEGAEPAARHRSDGGSSTPREGCDFVASLGQPA
jgi:hypothetical protein